MTTPQFDPLLDDLISHSHEASDISDLTATLDSRYVNVTGDTMTGALTVSLSGTGTSYFAYTGSLSNPSYSFSAATSTGFFYDPGNAQLVFAYGAARVMTGNNGGGTGGRLGINLDNPQTTLDVNGPIWLRTAGATNVVGAGKDYGTPANAASGYFLPYDAGTGNTTIMNTGNYSMYLGVNNSTVMTLKGGNVGIGTTSPGAKLHTLLSSSETANISKIVTIGHNSTGTPTAGFGASLDFHLASSTTANKPAASVAALWTDATHATRTSVLSFSTVNNINDLQDERARITTNGLGFKRTLAAVGDDGGSIESIHSNTLRVGGKIQFVKDATDDANFSAITFGTGTWGYGGTKEAMRLTSGSQRLGIGTTNPGAALDVAYGFATGTPTLLLGADNGVGSKTRTNATTKVATQGFAHYTNAEEPVATFIQTSTSAINSFALGGGTSYLNAVTQLQFFTAANTTTTTGTERMRIDSSGNVGIGTSSPASRLHVNGTVDDQQLIVEAHSTQTNNIVEIHDSSSNVLAYISPTGGALFKDKVIFTQTDGNENIDSLADGYMDYRATTAHRFGDGTNQTIIKADGEINLEGTARVYKVIALRPSGFGVPGTKPAASVEHGISLAWEFSDATDDTIEAEMQLPQDMDRTVAPEFNIGWDSDTADPGDDTKQCVWQLEYLYLSLDEDVTAAAQETLPVTDSASTTTNGLVVSTITGLDLPSATDRFMLIRLKRLGADGADTLGDVAYLNGCGFKYTSNKLGVAT